MNDSFEVEKQRAIDAWLTNRHEEADAHFTALLLDRPTDVELFALRSAVRMCLHRPLDSLADALECVELDPGFYKGYARVAAAKEALGDYEEALDHLDKGLALNPESKVLVREKARLVSRLEVPEPTTLDDEQEEAEEMPSSSATHETWLRNHPDDGFEAREKPGTVEEVLRQHATFRVRWMKSKIRRSQVEGEVRTILCLLYDLSRFVHQHPRIEFAMADVCEAIACHSEACSLQMQADLAQTCKPDEPLQSMDVCFYPPRIDYISPFAVPHLSIASLVLHPEGAIFEPSERSPSLPSSVDKESPWTVRPYPHPQGSEYEYANILPHYTLEIDHKTLQGHLAVLVFRLPTRFVVRVDEESWMGLSEASCCFVVAQSSEYEGLVEAANTISKDFGAIWIWLYPEEDHFRTGPRLARQSDSLAITVPQNTKIKVYRKSLAWQIHHILS